MIIFDKDRYISPISNFILQDVEYPFIIHIISQNAN